LVGVRSPVDRQRAEHRFAQVTDQRHREPERFIVAKRHEPRETERKRRARQHCAMTIHREGHERADVGERVESALSVRFEDGGHGASLCIQLCQKISCHRLTVHDEVGQVQRFGRVFTSRVRTEGMPFVRCKSLRCVEALSGCPWSSCNSVNARQPRILPEFPMSPRGTKISV
jgi:hypothetical protein